MPGRRNYLVYMLANAGRKVIDTGVTRDLLRRIAQHRLGQGSSFVSRYWVHNLVWFEVHEDPKAAILREKQLKAGSRQAKIALIESRNPIWNDLYEGL